MSEDLPFAAQRVCEIVSADFHEIFMDAYAVAAETTAATAGDANENIRVALAHLSQALVEGDAAKVEAEFDSARRRMALAAAECLMMAAFSIGNRIHTMLGTVEAGRQELPDSIRTRFKKLHIQSQKIESRIAHAGPETVAELRLLVEEARELERTIEALYPEVRGVKRARRRKAIIWLLRITFSLGLAYAADFAFTYIHHMGG